VRDPVLRARAAAEVEQIARVRAELADRVFLVPWQADEPVGPRRLRDLVASGLPAAVPG
jgi:arsenite-transporting ATPase